MNPEQQHERFTAVSRAEKRLDDVERQLADVQLVVEALAQEMIKDRDALAAAIGNVHGRCQARAERTAREQQTLWQRLRWLVRGAA
jgi:fructose/tagatose bisphosphate aldolase